MRISDFLSISIFHDQLIFARGGINFLILKLNRRKRRLTGREHTYILLTISKVPERHWICFKYRFNREFIQNYDPIRHIQSFLSGIDSQNIPKK